MYDLYALFDYLIGPLFIIGVAGTAAVRCPRLLPRILLGGILGALLGGIPSHLVADHFRAYPSRPERGPICARNPSILSLLG